MARYSLFVLKVPLNTNQPNKQTNRIGSCEDLASGKKSLHVIKLIIRVHVQYAVG